MQFHFCEEVTDGKSALQVSWTGGGRQKKQQLSSRSPQTNKSLRHMPEPQKDANTAAWWEFTTEGSSTSLMLCVNKETTKILNIQILLKEN